MSLRTFARNWAVGSAAIIAVSIALQSTGAAAPVNVTADAEPVPGMAGSDTSLSTTDSAVTTQGRGPFERLEVTVNQTRNLTNQAVSITWTGGAPTRQGPSRFSANYLQVMQCWGDPVTAADGSVGPPPEQCVFGAVGGRYEGISRSQFPAPGAVDRTIGMGSWPGTDPSSGYHDERTDLVWRPFRAVNGDVVDVQFDPTFNPDVIGGNFWQNPYFGIDTTNEIAGGVTGPNGTGAELFQVLTGVQSSGLGCGKRVQPAENGDHKVPQCWIVVVPRGLPVDENAGTPFEQNADQHGIVTGPLTPNAWQHRIAVPIEFNPVDSGCTLGADERRMVGSEVAIPAVVNWQPVLCTEGGLPPFSFVPVPDASARQQIATAGAGSPGMAVVSRPLPENMIDPASPVIYSPLSVSGAVIGFNVERFPKPDAPADELGLAGVRVAGINLTPRLVAKLLSQSYRAAVSIGGPLPAGYDWAAANPAHLVADEDFLRWNPEFRLLNTAEARAMSSLVLPTGTSDVATTVWEWILADPEAATWLAGEPDEWGMRANPVYLTDAAANPLGIAFGDPIPTSFPKADPYCFQGGPVGVRSVVPPPLCGTDWMPYTRGFADSAQIVRAASIGARVDENPWAFSSQDAWKREQPQVIGTRSVLALTDNASASRLGLQVARLSRAGDDGAQREFVGPDRAGLAAGVTAMAPRSHPDVLEPVPGADVAGAYPLTLVSYAAIKPLSLDRPARLDFADFLLYAAGPGQTPGLAPGQLPRGYLPLPADLQLMAVAAAFIVAVIEPAPATTTTTTVPDTSSSTTTASTAAPNTTAPPPPVEQPPAPPPPLTAPTATIRPPAPASPVSNTPGPPSGATTTTSSTTVPISSTSPPTSSAPVAPATSSPPPGDEPPVDAAPAVLTPLMNVSRSRFAVPGLGVIGLGSALGALEITKRPRRWAGDGQVDVPDEEV